MIYAYMPADAECGLRIAKIESKFFFKASKGVKNKEKLDYDYEL